MFDYLSHCWQDEMIMSFDLSVYYKKSEISTLFKEHSKHEKKLLEAEL